MWFRPVEDGGRRERVCPGRGGAEAEEGGTTTAIPPPCVGKRVKEPSGPTGVRPRASAARFGPCWSQQKRGGTGCLPSNNSPGLSPAQLQPSNHRSGEEKKIKKNPKKNPRPQNKWGQNRKISKYSFCFVVSFSFFLKSPLNFFRPVFSLCVRVCAWFGFFSAYYP